MMAYEFGMADQISLLDPCGLQTLWLPMPMSMGMSMSMALPTTQCTLGTLGNLGAGERCETQTTFASTVGEALPCQVLVPHESAALPFSQMSEVNLVPAGESTFATPESRGLLDEGATLWGTDGSRDHLVFYDEDDVPGPETTAPFMTQSTPPTQSCGFFFQTAGPVHRQNAAGSIVLYEFTPNGAESYPDKLSCPATWVQTGVWQRRDLDWPSGTFPLDLEPPECGSGAGLADPIGVKTESAASPEPESAPPPRPIFPAWVRDEVVPDEGYGTPEEPPSVTEAPRRGRKCKQARCACRACVHPELVPAGAAKCHSCDYEGCSKTYKKTSHLRAHVLLHQGLRPFKCTFGGCSKSFTRSDELSRHTRTHTKARTHPCHLCHKAFTRSDHRAKHIKSHERRERLHQIKAETDTDGVLADANPTTDALRDQPPLLLSNFYPHEMLHI